VALVDSERNRRRGCPRTFPTSARERLHASDQRADLGVRSGVVAAGGDDGDQMADLGVRSGVVAANGDNNDGGGTQRGSSPASPHSDAHGDDQKLHT
jgi:hypothetical protein